MHIERQNFLSKCAKLYFFRKYMCAYPTKNFPTRYPKHTYFFILPFYILDFYTVWAFDTQSILWWNYIYYYKWFHRRMKFSVDHARTQRVGRGFWFHPPPLKNLKFIGFPSILDRIPWNSQILKPAFNVGSLSSSQRNAIYCVSLVGLLMARF